MGHEVAGDQREVLAFLADPATYGLKSSADSIKRIDTHGAVVFLAGDDAYKIKRAIFYSFMDFSTLEKRRIACENEIAVNKANAPHLYLETIPIRRAAGGLRLGGSEGAIVEWAVHLRRFDETKTLDRLADCGEFDLAIVADLAEIIVASHECTLRLPLSGNAADIFGDVLRGTLDGLNDAEGVFASGSVAALRNKLDAAFKANEVLLQTRAGQGKVRRCHGDLHLRNIVLEDGRPVLFDAIEFDDSIATVDILYDLAFILMDLWQRDLPTHANRLLNRYLWRCPTLEQELEGLAALPLFLATRAAIRARVIAALGKLDPSGDHGREARRFLAASESFLVPQNTHLVAVGGLSGSGKSTFAGELTRYIGRAPGAVLLRSDIERKRFFGVGEYARLPEEAYRPEVTEGVYEHLRRMAQIALDSGQSVIVDAVHARAEEREALSKIAQATDAKFTAFWLEAPTETLVARVAARTHDASDADIAVVLAQAARKTPVLGWIQLDADAPLAELVTTALNKIA